MAATADPRAKSAAAQPHHLKPPPPPPRSHRVPSLPAVSAAPGANRDRRRSSTSRRHLEDDAVEEIRSKLMRKLFDDAARSPEPDPPAKPHRSPDPDPPAAPHDTAAAGANRYRRRSSTSRRRLEDDAVEEIRSKLMRKLFDDAARSPEPDPPAAPPQHDAAAAVAASMPWAAPPPPRGHRVPSLPAVSAAAGANRDRRRSSTSHRRGGADDLDEEPYDGGLEDLRAKLMGHLHDAADRLRVPAAKPHRPPETDPPAPPPQHDAAAAVAASMTWTLRERKRRPSAHGSAASSPATPWSTTMARDDGVRAPFAVALEAEEIEEDVYALTGARPRRRPRKRPRIVQRQLDTLFPGLWLTEITADAYRVPDD